MCFTIPKYGRVKTAKKDIKCWKLLRPDYKSQYQYFKYKPDVLYETLFKKGRSPLTFQKDRVITRGFHSYTTFGKANIENFKRGLYYEDGSICEFIIPKGSKYYQNDEDREYVSNQIIMKKHE